MILWKLKKFYSKYLLTILFLWLLSFIIISCSKPANRVKNENKKYLEICFSPILHRIGCKDKSANKAPKFWIGHLPYFPRQSRRKERPEWKRNRRKDYFP